MRFELCMKSLEKTICLIESIETFREFEELLAAIKARSFDAYYLNSEFSSLPENCINRIFDNGEMTTLLMKLIFNSDLKSYSVRSESEHQPPKIGVSFIDNSLIYSVDDFMSYLRNVLLLKNNNVDFFEFLKIVYVEIVFLDNVKKTLKDLDLNDKSIKGKVVQHIDSINSLFKVCFNSNEKKGLRVVIREFKSKCNIDSSAENNRKTVRDYRTITLIDCNKDEKKIDVEFELHTKLDFTDLHERIYFSQGVVGIQSQSIIVAHIGKHLYDPESKIKIDFSRLPESEIVDFNS